MNFNINDYVKVKLTNYGIEILKQQHDELKNKFGGDIGEFDLKLDSEGYYETQLWSLMSDLGQYCIMGRELPFETNIILKNE